MDASGGMDTKERSTGRFLIRLEGHLDDHWADWFGDVAIIREANGQTVLTGPLVDQAALFHLLRKVRDLGLPLLLVDCQPTTP